MQERERKKKANIQDGYHVLYYDCGTTMQEKAGQDKTAYFFGCNEKRGGKLDTKTNCFISCVYHLFLLLVSGMCKAAYEFFLMSRTLPGTW